MDVVGGELKVGGGGSAAMLLLWEPSETMGVGLNEAQPSGLVQV